MSETSRARRRPRPIWVATVGWLVVLVLVAGVGALLAVGANGPADPRLAPAGQSDEAPIEFGEVAFQVMPGPRSGLPATTEGCAQLAETELQLQKGLMGRRDLGGYDAIVFRFAADTKGTFYMRNVKIPLSIAWFDAEGRLVSTADMDPCPDREGCPQYPAAGPYRFALEVERGGLSRLGVTGSSVLRLGGACPGR